MSGDTDQYPNTPEVRDWAMSIAPRMALKGPLPRAVILGWNKTHPDRPYIPSQGHHGTPSGYFTEGCRCGRCKAAQHDVYVRDRDARRDFGESR